MCPEIGNRNQIVERGYVGQLFRISSSHRREVNPDFALLILFLVATLNILDRNIILILQEPIKADLGLNDTQLGSLTGLSFAIVYCIAALPLARLADRSSRIRIVGASVAVWSLLTAASGAATSFIALVALRMGVAAGEAGGNPASFSLMSDYYPPHKRPLAFALWALCQPVGSAIGLLSGGLLAHAFGWRGTFAFVGVLGLIFAPFIFRMREPPRGRFDVNYTLQPQPTFKELGQVLVGTPALRWLLGGSAMQGFALFSIQSWAAPFYARVFGVPSDQLALQLFVIIGVAGGVGILLGGLLGRALGPRDPSWLMLVPAISSVAALPLLLGQLLVQNLLVSLTLGFFATISLTTYMSCINAAAQLLVVPTARAVVTVMIAYAMNIGGLALGPTAVGMVSDYLTSETHIGADALRYALLLSAAATPIAALCYFQSARFLKPSQQPSSPS